MSDIWDDADVQQIVTMNGGQPQLQLPELQGSDAELMFTFMRADMAVDDSATTSIVLVALTAGVKAFEGFEDPMPSSWAPGWKKFVLYNTGCNVQVLWNNFRKAEETAIFADWVTSTVSKYGWGPDGNASAIGRLHSNCMAVAAKAGGGVRVNAATGRFEAPDGDTARSYDPSVGLQTPAGRSPAARTKRGFFRRI